MDDDFNGGGDDADEAVVEFDPLMPRLNAIAAREPGAVAARLVSIFSEHVVLPMVTMGPQAAGEEIDAMYEACLTWKTDGFPAQTDPTQIAVMECLVVLQLLRLLRDQNLKHVAAVCSHASLRLFLEGKLREDWQCVRERLEDVVGWNSKLQAFIRRRSDELDIAPKVATFVKVIKATPTNTLKFKIEVDAMLPSIRLWAGLVRSRTHSMRDLTDVLFDSVSVHMRAHFSGSSWTIESAQAMEEFVGTVLDVMPTEEDQDRLKVSFLRASVLRKVQLVQEGQMKTSFFNAWDQFLQDPASDERYATFNASAYTCEGQFTTDEDVGKMRACLVRTRGVLSSVFRNISIDTVLEDDSLCVDLEKYRVVASLAKERLCDMISTKAAADANMQLWCKLILDKVVTSKALRGLIEEGSTASDQLVAIDGYDAFNQLVSSVTGDGSSSAMDEIADEQGDTAPLLTQTTYQLSLAHPTQTCEGRLPLARHHGCLLGGLLDW